MSSPVVVCSPDELAQIVEAAVERALTRRRAANDSDDQWLDAAGVAEMLHVHPRSVQKMVRAQGLPAHRLGPKLLRYQRAEVERWIRERRGQR